MAVMVMVVVVVVVVLCLLSWEDTNEIEETMSYWRLRAPQRMPQRWKNEKEEPLWLWERMKKKKKKKE
jgi:hypothetical protein